LEGNIVTGNTIGLQINDTGNSVANNIVKDNADNYNFVAGNQLDLLLCQVPESIDWPANVKVAGSLNVTSGNAITINTNDVTLDLNGFTISSTTASATGYGILINGGLTDITIVNGHIRGGVTNDGNGVYSGSGFAYGISYFCNPYSGNPPVNVLVSHVSVSGCLNYGIFVGHGDSTVADTCIVRTVGNYGISASTVKESSAIDCGSDAIDGDQVSDCRGQASGSGYGILAVTAHNCYGSSGGGVGVSAFTALNCYGSSGSGNGISAIALQNCYGSSDSGDGVYTAYVAIGCYGSSSSGAGLHAYIANSCFSTTGDGSITYKYNMP
jgi:hypothetical protein